MAPGLRQRVLVGILAGCMLPAGALASVFYGSVGPTEIVGQSVAPGSILRLSPSQGTGVLVGDPVAAEGVGIVGIDIDSQGRLYGSTRASGAPSDLLHIAAGDGSLIQDVGPIRDAAENPLAITDLAFQPGTDVLFGVSAGAGPAPCASCLYTIDLVTAQATLIGSPGLPNGGLAFAPDGTLYWVTSFTPLVLATIDPANASVLTSEPIVIEPPWDAQFAGFFDGLAVRPDDGVLYATHGAGSSEIFRRDPQTGTWAVIGATGQNMTDLAFRTPELPLAGARGLALAAMLLLVSGGLGLRRMRPLGGSS